MDMPAAFDIEVREVAYQTQGGKPILARICRPIGTGPFPATVDIHGGAWNNNDRMHNADAMERLARTGVVVVSPDFRMPPEGPYPISVADIHLSVRWLKAHAKELGSKPELVGAYGTSSGGHQILLVAMRPHDLRYAALPLPEAPEVDATVAFVMAGWAVLDPFARYQLAKSKNRESLIRSHDRFWKTEEAMAEGSPPMILKRGEKVATPPAFLFQGTKEIWTSKEQVESFAADYRKIGGRIETAYYEGEEHGFMRDNKDSPNTAKALADMRAFIRSVVG